MSQAPHSFRHLALVAVMTALTCWSSAQVNSFAQFGRFAQSNSDNIFWFTSPLPLGAEGFVLHPVNRHFYVLACVENRRFDRLQVSRVRTSPFVIDAAGQVWHEYPAELNFRVTATAIQDILNNLDTSDITEPGDINSFLLGLKFRLKVYHELDMRILPPTSVNLIGLPADEPGEERVFRVSFNTGQVPVDDRLVLEVLSPGGQLLTRFHLELL
jgi:hypothetical protein